MAIWVNLLSFSVILLALALYLEYASRSEEQRLGSSLARRIVGSQRSNLVFYTITTEFLFVGLWFWAYETTANLGLLVLLFVGIVAVFVTVAGVNRIRFVGDTIRDEVIANTYFEAIRNLEPEEGIEYIVQYITNHKYGVPSDHLRIFLVQMAKRRDRFGDVAREKLFELGLTNKQD